MLTLTGEDSAADGGPEDAVTRDHSSGRQDEKVFHENNDWLGGSGSFSEERDEGNVVSLLLALPASREVHPHDAASSYVMTLNCHDWLLQFQVPKLKAARVSPVHHLSRAMAKKRVKKQNKKVCSGR